jgi:N-dimethylarginine dimethylaminohydrolase
VGGRRTTGDPIIDIKRANGLPGFLGTLRRTFFDIFHAMTTTTIDGSSRPQDWRERIATTPAWGGVLLCHPAHFDVLDVKNSFMKGQIGSVDKERALHQWHQLTETYRSLGVEVHVLDPIPDLEDMVFCANPVCILPRADGGADVIPSHMNHPSRQREVEHVLGWFDGWGCDVTHLPEGAGRIEGHGDVLVVPARRLALGGHGGRTELRALDALAAACDITLIPLALQGDVFYHLDTCLAVLDEDTVLIHPPAFHEDALGTLSELFPRILIAEPTEASDHLAVNVHALADGTVVMGAQSPRTAARLREAGFHPATVDVSEFHKSGGSVFCMRLDVPALTR